MQLRKLMLLPFAALLLAAPSALAATKTVSITNSGFVPNAVTIEEGDSITWTNSDNRNRQPVSQEAGFASPILKPGETFTFAFKKEGKFTVRDALVATQRSTVTVTKPAPIGTPSLTASKRSVIYGGSLALTGKVPTGNAGEKVTLRAEVLTPAGTRQASAVSETSTASDGTFSFTHVPTAQTTYTVAWQATPATSTTSSAVTVSVAPRVGLGVVRRLSGRRVVLATKATSAISYAGRSVLVQRRSRFGEWISIKRVVLRSGPFATQTTVRLPKGLSRVRVLLPKAQAGTGYVAGVSRTLLIVR
jgi:cupredoxin-like protein